MLQQLHAFIIGFGRSYESNVHPLSSFNFIEVDLREYLLVGQVLVNKLPRPSHL